MRKPCFFIADHIGTLGQKERNHIGVTIFCCLVYRGLAVHIRSIDLSSIGQKELNHLSMIIDCCFM